MFTHEIVIVGAGPAGSVSAIELANLDADLAKRVLLLDKAIFPRPKLCAGGLSLDTDVELQNLGVEIDVPAVPVHATQFLLPTGRLTFNHQNQFRIVRRTEFDHSLLKAAQKRGIVTHEGEEVLDVVADQKQVVIHTSKSDYSAKILIAADGANSKIRVQLGLSRSDRLMVAMEIHAAFADSTLANLQENMAILDLRILNHGVPGYCWIFPTVNEHSRLISLGLMAAPFGSKEVPRLKTIFGTWLNGCGLDLNNFKVASHPSIRYEPKASCSQNRVVFVGDAAGVDPLFGEGIVSAMANGRIAARAAVDALQSQDFSFANYEQQVRSSAIGSLMRRRRMIARRLYQKPKLAHFFLKQGALIRGLGLLHALKHGGQIGWEPSAPKRK